MSDLTRRGFLAGAAALPLVGVGAQALPRIRPPRLRPGDQVAILCPSGNADDQAHLDRGAAKVESLGFRPVIAPNALAKWGYLAGTDDQRAEDLNWAFRHPDIRGIIVLRGGYGATRLLPRLNYAAIHDDPKVVMGYSDFTGLGLAILERAGVVTFHGPCAESTWDEFARSSLRVVMGSSAGSVTIPTDGEPRATLVGGQAEGQLVGGNLTLVTHLVGTEYLPSLSRAILFLEDIGEDPYRVDRMLTQILLTGVKPAGIVFGNFRKRGVTEIEDADGFSMEQVLLERAKAFGVPAVSGFPFGHVASNHILPIGGRAKLDADRQTLWLDQAVV